MAKHGSKGVAEKSAEKENPFFIGKRQVEQVPFESIKVDWKANPRGVVTDDSVDGMKPSIKAVGIIQPVGLKRENGSFRLLFGYRRFKCAELLKMKSVPAIVFDDVEVDEGGHLLAHIENGVRLALNPIKEARSYSTLIENYGGTEESMKDISRITGAKVSHVRRVLSLLDAPKQVVDLVEFGDLPAVVALELTDKDGKYLPNDVITQVLTMLPGKGTLASAADAKRAVNAVLKAAAEAGAEGEDEKEGKADDATKAVRPTKSEVMESIAKISEDIVEGDMKVDVESASFAYGFLAGANWAVTGDGSFDKPNLVRKHADALILSHIVDDEQESMTDEAFNSCVDVMDDLEKSKLSLTDKFRKVRKATDDAVELSETAMKEIAKDRKAKDKAKAEAKK